MELLQPWNFISSLLILDKKPSEILSNYTKIPQVNKAISVTNRDIINDKDLKNLIKEIESDMTVGRLLRNHLALNQKLELWLKHQR